VLVVHTSRINQSSEYYIVNVRLRLGQNFVGREPEMHFFAALRAAFYKKRTEKWW
jgi:hypothetical protein